MTPHIVYDRTRVKPEDLEPLGFRSAIPVHGPVHDALTFINPPSTPYTPCPRPDFALFLARLLVGIILLP